MSVTVTYPGVYVQELSGLVRPIDGVATSITAFVGETPCGSVNDPANIFSFADFATQFGGLADGSETGHAVWQYFLNGGREAWIVRVADATCEAQLTAGIRSLDAVDLFNLLVLPGVSMPGVVTAAVAYCERRRAFLILDSPSCAKTPDEIAQIVAAGGIPRTRNAAVYYPWLIIADPLHDGQTRIAPPSGTIAGIIAATDETRGVWKAPAGTGSPMKGVQGLEHGLSDAEQGPLNSMAVNCLRTFPTYGHVVWGARTLQGADELASEWKYIAVRRLALFLEESLYRETQWVAFEPNDEPLWAKIRLNVGVFLGNVYRQGALQGTSQRDAFFVKCDQSTTTQDDIARGVVNIVVGFAPLEPAEFIVIQLQQLAGQSAA